MPHLETLSRFGLPHATNYVPSGMDGSVNIVPPAIDPLAPKNMALSPEDAVYVCNQFGLDVDRPLICQVSRFDPWKDPLGVIDAYRIVKEQMPDVQLALVGSMATDDPEGWDFFNATIAHAEGDPDIHILNNFNNVGSIEVNAFQSHSDVLVQKCDARGVRPDGLRGDLEGASRSSPATSAGSRCRSRTASPGYLVTSVEECAERASAPCCRDPALGKELGRRGKEHVRAHFLMPRLLRDWLRIFAAGSGSDDERRLAATGAGLQPRPGDVRRAAASMQPRGRRPGDRAHRAGLAPRRDLGRLGDDRRTTSRQARRHGGRPFTVQTPGGSEYRIKLVDSDPEAYERFYSDLRQPDAVVHPALPVGPVQRP